MSDCERSELVQVLLDDEAELEERAAAEAHLAGCAPCRETLAGYRQAAAALRDLPRERPGEPARARAYAAALEAMSPAAQVPAPATAPAAARRPRGQLLRFGQVLAAAACLLLVVSLARPGPRSGGAVATRDVEPAAPKPAAASQAPPPAPGQLSSPAPGQPSSPAPGESHPAAPGPRPPEAEVAARPEPAQERLDSIGRAGEQPGSAERRAQAGVEAEKANAYGEQDAKQTQARGARPAAATAPTPPPAVDGTRRQEAAPPAWLAAWSVGEAVYALDAQGNLRRATLPAPGPGQPAPGAGLAAAPGAQPPAEAKRGAGAERLGKTAAGRMRDAEDAQKDEALPDGLAEEGLAQAAPAQRLAPERLADLPPPGPVDAAHDAIVADELEQILALELRSADRDAAWGRRAAALLAALGDRAAPGEEGTEVLRLKMVRRLETRRLRSLQEADLEAAKDAAPDPAPAAGSSAR